MGTPTETNQVTARVSHDKDVRIRLQSWIIPAYRCCPGWLVIPCGWPMNIYHMPCSGSSVPKATHVQAFLVTIQIRLGCMRAKTCSTRLYPITVKEQLPEQSQLIVIQPIAFG